MNNKLKNFLQHKNTIIKIDYYLDDLYNFIKLIKEVGSFYKDDIEIFEKNCCDSRNKEEKRNKEYVTNEDFSKDYFYHLCDINHINRNNVGIEYQNEKGFTFFDLENINENEVNIYSVEELISDSDYAEKFNLDKNKITSFYNETKDNDLKCLDDFVDFMQYTLRKYNRNNKISYNIYDEEFNEFRYEENISKGNFNKLIKDYIDRELDYIDDEYNINYLSKEDLEYSIKNIFNCLNIVNKYNLSNKQDKDYYQYYRNFLIDLKNQLKKLLNEELN